MKKKSSKHSGARSGDDVLSKLRQEIDEADDQILRLLSLRAQKVLEVGKHKELFKLPVYVPAREQEILERICRLNGGPLSPESLQSIFMEVIGSCRSLERGLRVAYLGPEATFSHHAAQAALDESPALMAAKRQFGSRPVFVPVKTIRAVFEEVSHTRVDLGVVPIENSTVGTLNEALDTFAMSDLKICAEIYLGIHHHLLSRCPLHEIEKVFSKDVVFPQCRTWLDNELPKAEWVEVESTSEGVKRSLEEPHAAAIAGKMAAETFDMPVQVECIEDDPDNSTRFFVISREAQPPTGRDKTSVMLAIKDKVGALYDVLSPFKEHKVNLTKIESRPSRLRAWDYFFFVDFLGHWEDEGARAAIREIEREAMFVKWLGSYVQGVKVS